MRLDPRLGQDPGGIFVRRGIRLVQQRGRTVFPTQPRLCGGHRDRRIGIVHATPVRLDHRAALARRNMRLVARPAFRKHPARPAVGLVEPAVLLLAAEVDAAHDHAGRTRGVRLRVGQRQRRTPRAAEHQPALDPRERTHGFDVRDQVCGGVVAQLAERRRLAGTALVEQDDPVARRIEEAPMHRRQARARSAVQEDHGNAVRIPAFLHMERVQGIDGKPVRAVRRDLGIQRAHGQGSLRGVRA